MMVSAENDPRRAGTIWMLDLDEATPVVTPRVHAEFRRVTPDLMPALSTVRGYDVSAEFLHRFETGRQCYGAWVEGQLAAFGWVSYDDEDIGELNLRIKLLPGEVYVWDCATAPRFRGNGLYSALLSYMLGELRDQKICRAWIGADLDNVPSQKGIARAGFHPPQRPSWACPRAFPCLAEAATRRPAPLEQARCRRASSRSALAHLAWSLLPRMAQPSSRRGACMPSAILCRASGILWA